LTTPVSSLAVSVSQTAGTLTESVDAGTPLSCADPAHGRYTGFDPNWYGFSITGTSDKTLTYTMPSVAFDAGLQFCFGATVTFPTSSGGNAAAGTLPDGTAGFIGLLPSCASPPTGFPCVVSVVATSTGSGSITTVDVPQAFAGDPFGHM
jgi:hypothetical protein